MPEGNAGAAAARRRASLQAELPELWPTEASMDEAAALRAQVRRLQARLAENSPEWSVPAPRGLPTAPVERGAIPQPEPVDCADGEAPARFGLRRGPMRRGRQPKRPRKAVTYLFPRLRGGMEVEDGELLTGLRSLRGALARGLVPQVDRPGVRRPVMMSGPPSTAGGALPLDEVFEGGVFDLRFGSPPTFRLRYRSTSIELPAEWVTGYLREYIATRGTIPVDSFEGPIAGAGIVLDTFWPRFRHRVEGLPVSRRGYGRLIGCWMLPYTAEEGIPTSLFFQTAGEQRAVHDLTCQLLHAYVDEARVPINSRTGRKLVDDDGWCSGLSAFIRGVLEGRTVAALRQGDDVDEPEVDPGSWCTDAQLHYTNKNEAGTHASETWRKPCVGGTYGEPESVRCWEISKKCNSMKEDDLLDWNDYVVEVREVAFDPSLGRTAPYAWLCDADRSSSSTAAWPAGGASVTACNLGGRRSLQLTPAHVAFDGELIDLLMFMAQLCLDYCRSLIREGRARSGVPAVAEALRAGSDFAAYALRVVAGRASLLVHEFGHMYLGGIPHAGFQQGDGRPRWRSCFDIARHTVLARMVADNGLPPDEYVAGDAADAFDTGGTVTSLQVDGGGGLVSRAFKVQNPYYVFSDWVRPTSCENVPFGTERSEDIRWSRIDPSFSACIGRFWTYFDQPGARGGGYSMRVGNGCDCEAPRLDTAVTVLGLSLTSFSIDYSAACYSLAPAGAGEVHAST